MRVELVCLYGLEYSFWIPSMLYSYIWFRYSSCIHCINIYSHFVESICIIVQGQVPFPFLMYIYVSLCWDIHVFETPILYSDIWTLLSIGTELFPRVRFLFYLYLQSHVWCTCLHLLLISVHIHIVIYFCMCYIYQQLVSPPTFSDKVMPDFSLFIDIMFWYCDLPELCTIL